MIYEFVTLTIARRQYKPTATLTREFEDFFNDVVRCNDEIDLLIDSCQADIQTHYPTCLPEDVDTEIRNDAPETLWYEEEIKNLQASVENYSNRKNMHDKRAVEVLKQIAVIKRDLALIQHISVEEEEQKSIVMAILEEHPKLAAVIHQDDKALQKAVKVLESEPILMSEKLKQIKESVETLGTDAVNKVRSDLFSHFTPQLESMLDMLRNKRQQAMDENQARVEEATASLQSVEELKARVESIHNMFQTAEEVTTKQEEIDEWKQRVSRRDGVITRTKQALADAQKDVERSNDAAGSHERRAHEAEAGSRSLRTERDRHLQWIKELAEEKESLSEIIKRMEIDKVETLDILTKAKDNQIDELTKASALDRSMVKTLSENLTSADESKKWLEIQFDRVREKNELLEKELKDKKQAGFNLGRDLDHLRLVEGPLKDEAQKALQNQLAEEKEQSSKTRAAYTELQRECNSFQNVIKANDDTIAELQSSLEQLTIELKDIETDRDNRISELGSVREKHATQVQGLEKGTQDLRNELDNEKQRALEKLGVDFQKDKEMAMEALELEHANQKNELKEANTNAIDELRKSHAAEVDLRGEALLRTMRGLTRLVHSEEHCALISGDMLDDLVRLYTIFSTTGTEQQSINVPIHPGPSMVFGQPHELDGIKNYHVGAYRLWTSACLGLSVFLDAESFFNSHIIEAGQLDSLPLIYSSMLRVLDSLMEKQNTQLSSSMAKIAILMMQGLTYLRTIIQLRLISHDY